jgi:hypothetical protein
LPGIDRCWLHKSFFIECFENTNVTRWGGVTDTHLTNGYIGLMNTDGAALKYTAWKKA